MEKTELNKLHFLLKFSVNGESRMPSMTLAEAENIQGNNTR